MATKQLLPPPPAQAQKADCLLADYVDDHPNSPDSGVVSHHGDDESLSATNSPVKYGHYYHHHPGVPTQIVRPLQSTSGHTSLPNKNMVTSGRCPATNGHDDESPTELADSGAGSEDSLSIASSSGQVDGKQVLKFHCKWSGCQWPGCEDDLVDHIVEHLPKASASEKDEGSEFVCKWLGCKVFNVPFKKSQTLHDHCIAKHCGDFPFKCIVDGCCARFKSIKLRQRHVDDHFRVQPSSSKSYVQRSKKTFHSTLPQSQASSSSSSLMMGMMMSKTTRSLSSSVSTDSVISSHSFGTSSSSASSSSSAISFSSSSAYSSASSSISSSSTANHPSSSSISLSTSSSAAAMMSYRFHHHNSVMLPPPLPVPLSQQARRRCQEKKLMENCCCTCLCHSCYVCTPEVYIPSRCSKEFQDHTVACCNYNRTLRKLPPKKKRKCSDHKDILEIPDYRISQMDEYYSHKRDLQLAGLSSAYARAGPKKVFNPKLFQTRPGYVELTSEVVEEFSELGKDGKRVTKCKLTWSPANLIPDSVIPKTDLEKHRKKFVSEVAIQRLEDRRINLYGRKRRR